MRRQTPWHGGSWTPCITRVPLQPNPAPRLFPPDGREAGAFFDAAGSQWCGGRRPGTAGHGHPASPMCPQPNLAPRFSPRTGGRLGHLLWGTALFRGILRGAPQYVIYSPARQRAKNRQPLTHSGKQGLPVFVLGFLPHRGRGIGGLSPGWPGASCSDTGSCSVRYKPVHRHLSPPRESCAPADRCPASGGFPPG